MYSQFLVLVPFPSSCIGGPNTYARLIASGSSRFQVFYFHDYSHGFASSTALLSLWSDFCRLIIKLLRCNIVLNQDVQLIGLVSLFSAFICRKRFVTRVTSDPILDRSCSPRSLSFYVRVSIILLILFFSSSVYLPSHIFKSRLLQTLSSIKLSRHLRNKIKVVPNPFQLSSTVRTSTPDSYVHDFIIVSRLEPFKNIDSILLALDQLSIQSGPFSCGIVGDGSQMLLLRSLASQLNLRTCFYGSLATDDCLTVTHRSRVFINNALYSETFCYSLLESLCLGCFAFFADISLAREVVPPFLSSRLFELGDPSSQEVLDKLFNALSLHKKQFQTPQPSLPSISIYSPSAIRTKLFNSILFSDA